MSKYIGLTDEQLKAGRVQLCLEIYIILIYVRVYRRFKKFAFFTYLFQGFNEKPDTAKSVLLTKTELSKEKGDSKFHRRDRVYPELYKNVKISFGNNMA